MKKINQVAWEYLNSLSNESRLKEWMIGGLISQDPAFGTHAQVNSLTNSNCFDGIFLFSDEQLNSVKIKHFVDLSEEIRTSIEKLNISEFFLLPEKTIELECDGNIIYLLLYPENSISEPLSSKIQYIAKTFHCTPDVSLHQSVLTWLIKYLKITEGKFSHSYICPETIVFHEGKFKLILPGFVSLLSEPETNNIKTILHQNPDLEVYPLSPEYIINLKYDLISYEKSDFWSTGVIDSLLLTGKPPFTIINEPQYLSAIRKGDVKLSDLSDANLKQRLTKFLQFDSKTREIPSFYSNKDNDTSVIQDTKAGHSPGNGISIYPADDIIILPGDDVEVTIAINFDQLLNPSAIKEIGRNYMVNPEVDLVLSNQERYCFSILPEPNILFLPAYSIFQRTGLQDEYRLDFSFKLKRSTINIQNIGMSIYHDDGSLVYMLNCIQWTESNKNLISSDKVYEISIKFNIDGKEIVKVGEFYIFKFEFTLKDWGQYQADNGIRLRLMHPGIPKLDANLSNLGYPTNVRDKKDIKLINIGGETITIRDLYTSVTSSIVSVGFSKMENGSRRLEPDKEIRVDLLISTKNIVEGFHEEGSIVVKYTTFSSTIALSREFDYTVKVSNFGRKEISIAIDFGTSNTCLYYDDGLRKDLFVWQDGNKYIPSFICYSPNYEDPWWGEAARDIYTALDGQDVFHSIKKEIGNNGATIPVRTFNGIVNKSYNQMADDFLQLLINRLRFDAGYDIGEIFLAHPTSFDEIKVNSYKTIVANIPRNSNRKIIEFDEALCGAHNYIASGGKSGEYYLIYDFGGGTTDILFARYVEEEVKTPFSKSIKKIVKVFSSGFDIGGEDLNEWLSLLIVEKIFKLSEESKLVIPFVERYDARRFNTLVVNECDNLRAARANASKKLWLLSEGLKIDNFSLATSKDFNLPAIKNSDLRQYQQWNAQLSQQKYEEINLAGYQPFIDAIPEIKKLFYRKFDGILKVKLEKLIDFIQPVVAEVKLNLILLGQSSRFERLRELFEEVCEQKKISVKIEIPKELKTIVVEGCFELGSSRSSVKIDDSSVKKYLSHGKENYILPDKRTVDNPILANHAKDAVYKTEPFNISDLQESVSFFERCDPFTNFTEIALNFNTAAINQLKKQGAENLLLYLYYPKSGKLSWIITDKNGEKLDEGSAC